MDMFEVFRSKIIIDKDGNEVKSGLGGWLILVGLGVVYPPLSTLKDGLEGNLLFLGYFNDGLYGRLTYYWQCCI